MYFFYVHPHTHTQAFDFQAYHVVTKNLPSAVLPEYLALVARQKWPEACIRESVAWPASAWQAEEPRTGRLDEGEFDLLVATGEASALGSRGLGQAQLQRLSNRTNLVVSDVEGFIDSSYIYIYISPPALRP